MGLWRWILEAQDLEEGRQRSLGVVVLTEVDLAEAVEGRGRLAALALELERVGSQGGGIGAGSTAAGLVHEIRGGLRAGEGEGSEGGNGSHSSSVWTGATESGFVGVALRVPGPLRLVVVEARFIFPLLAEDPAKGQDQDRT